MPPIRQHAHRPHPKPNPCTNPSLVDDHHGPSQVSSIPHSTLPKPDLAPTLLPVLPSSNPSVSNPLLASVQQLLPQDHQAQSPQLLLKQGLPFQGKFTVPLFPNPSPIPNSPAASSANPFPPLAEFSANPFPPAATILFPPTVAASGHPPPPSSTSSGHPQPAAATPFSLEVASTVNTPHPAATNPFPREKTIPPEAAPTPANFPLTAPLTAAAISPVAVFDFSNRTGKLHFPVPFSGG
ncbi:hypothetical protein MRB53_011082 [Persea americana]|uniref:Uncharacterized protein n=1 Tax=Persea americana TaxID=3435 RepID=A0ACC2LTY0_PERAE|nr:hypothetical protein MRB53_011082 [Persea americana]